MSGIVMKIAMLTELFYPYLLGGGEKRYYEIAKRLVAMGNTVEVYSMRIENSPSSEIHEGIAIKRIGMLNHPRNHRSLVPMPPYLISLIFKRMDADILDCNTYFPCLAGKIKGYFGKPVVVTIHDIYKGHWGESLGNMSLDNIGNIIEKIICESRYNGIICPSTATIRLLKENFKVRSPISLVPNGIDTKMIDAVPGPEREAHKICYSGRLVPHKHIDDLIKAVEILKKDYPDIKCEIVGDGVLRNDLENMVKSKNLEGCIEFTGFLPEYADMIRIMKSSSVFVNASTREGFGIVMLEAMRCGCSVVGYELDAYKDFCDEDNSILAKERDLEALAESIRKGFEKRENYSKGGHETAGRYDWDEIAKMIESEYKKALDKS